MNRTRVALLATLLAVLAFGRGGVSAQQTCQGADCSASAAPVPSPSTGAGNWVRATSPTITQPTIAGTWTSTGNSLLATTNTTGTFWGTGLHLGVQYNTANTPDNSVMNVATTAKSVDIRDQADRNSDLNNGPCGTSACADPTLIIHSTSPGTTKWISMTHDQTKGVLQSGIGPVSVTNGLMLNTGTRPTCDSSSAGTFWRVAGGAGVADTIEACGKSAADSFSWIAVVTF